MDVVCSGGRWPEVVRIAAEEPIHLAWYKHGEQIHTSNASTVAAAKDDARVDGSSGAASCAITPHSSQEVAEVASTWPLPPASFASRLVALSRSEPPARLAELSAEEELEVKFWRRKTLEAETKSTDLERRLAEVQADLRLTKAELGDAVWDVSQRRRKARLREDVIEEAQRREQLAMQRAAEAMTAGKEAIEAMSLYVARHKARLRAGRAERENENSKAVFEAKAVSETGLAAIPAEDRAWCAEDGCKRVQASSLAKEGWLKKGSSSILKGLAPARARARAWADGRAGGRGQREAERAKGKCLFAHLYLRACNHVHTRRP